MVPIVGPLGRSKVFHRNSAIACQRRGQGAPMMETTDVVSVADAVELIDSNLKDLQGRELVSAAEVADLLLDLRMLLAAAQVEPAPMG